MAKKSKMFRVATEGQTTDGRTISREWIEQMASTYNPEKYGARVWLEHFRGLLPDGMFKALGDVEKLEARKNADRKMELYAQIDPHPSLVAMNKDRQKVYTSIEVDPDFAGSGKAYMYGLGVTDSPASLGTERLQFSVAQKPADNDKIVFSAFAETELEFIDEEDKGPSLIDQVKAIFSKKQTSDDAQYNDITDAVTSIAERVQSLSERQIDLSGYLPEATFAELKTAHDSLQNQFAELKTQLEKEPGTRFTQRPPATGGDGDIKTDC